MDSYTYNTYARYYDKNFPSDFQKSCNESRNIREDYQIDYNKRFPLETKPVDANPIPSETKLDCSINLCPNIN